MRHRYVVCYDVSDPKRLAKVYKKMRGFGDPIQYSVFKCDLSAQEKVLMVTELSQLINHKEDKVMVINVGLVTGRDDVFEFLGRSVEFTVPVVKII